MSSSHDQALAPPRPKFVIDDNTDGDHDSRPSSSHSRDMARQSGTNSVDTPPITPRSRTFSNAVNPFSPPASVRSFSSPDQTPMATPGITGTHAAPSHYPFPDATPRSGMTSVATSVAELPRIPSTYNANRFEYPISNQGSSIRLRETFTSPPVRPTTVYSTLPSAVNLKRDRPKSTMLSAMNTPLQKPWLTSKDPLSRIAYALTYFVVFLGVVGSVVRCYVDFNNVQLVKGNLCMVLDQNFTTATEDEIFGDNGVFFREVDMSGFGNGEFEMTTSSSNNSFIKDGRLYINPTLTSDNLGTAAILDGYIYNSTDCTFNITQGTSYTSSSTNDPTSVNTTSIGADSTFDAAAYYKACSAVSNATSGTVINPVQSARLSTRKSASIRFGRVEVKAKIPTGDWMWPAIWMLPVDNHYGPWPMSGEIDIMEARGNAPSYPKQGTNYVRGSLNWGPMTWLNAVSKTYGWKSLRRGGYNDGFHTYALEWTEQFMRLYVDSRLTHMLELKLNEPFFDRGEFPPVIQNGSETIVLQNPWINGTRAAPFDQPFYLILDVGVGGTNGWFPDNAGGKSWLDGSLTAMRDFITTQDKWYPSWPQNVDDRAMIVDSVKMWQLC